MSNRFDPDQARHFVGPDLGPNCLQRLSADIFEPQHEISNIVVCATNKGSDQPAHTRSLIRAFASRLNIR